MITKEEAYSKVSELVERFGEQFSSYKKADYNETLTRRDFIDPFFKALGWDIDNSQGYSEANREVIHEDKLKVGTATKAPDYSFRLPGGKRQFFLEAKKPSVVVKDETAPAYQVRRYGWSAKLPISLITDFEEFAVYDCTKRPFDTDKASTARIKYLTYKNYLDEFDFLWNTFSKINVLKGGLEKYIQSDTQKKGTATVDKEFLASLDGWQIQLALNIALRNKELSEDELNFVVQQTIDRIIFLRIAEDRKVEPYGQLQNLLKGSKEEGGFYKQLYTLFKEADSKYNSGLFDFRKDKVSANITIDNKVIKTIINELYYPVCPYEFSVLGVEILGSAYEQFLGKQIKLDKNHRAVIEEKPEVRKAGGVYYTPQYIVEYIIEQTIGKLTEGKTPEQVAQLKIVDPSCGSGSFLLGAYDYLLKWHWKYYTPDFLKLSEVASDSNVVTKQREAAIRQRNKLPLTPEGYLTTGLKKQILLNNIYGVDLDIQAVEVTKLSLLLKCMEGETASSINAEMRFGERVLPTLDNNIKSGNSLIDLDFYDTQIDFGEEKKIKPFNWEQAFPQLFGSNMKGGTKLSSGFDVVIGNPPWGASLNDDELSYLRRKHSSIIVRMIDTYMYFINFSIDLLKPFGQYGMIIPSTFLNQKDVSLLRKKILEKVDLSIVVNLGDKVFGPKVLNTSTILAFTKNSKPTNRLIVGDIRELDPEEKPIELNLLKPVSKEDWVRMVKGDESYTFITYDASKTHILSKLKGKFSAFQDILEGEIQRGISPDYAKAFIVDEQTVKEKHLEKEALRPLILGKHVFRNSTPTSNDFIIYLTKNDNINLYPNIKRHLQDFKTFITCKEVAEGKHPWYSLHRPRNPEIFIGKKFVGLTTSKKIVVAIDKKDYYATDSLYLFKVKASDLLDENFVLGVIHSKLFQFLYDVSVQGGQRVIPQIKAANLYNLPFPEIVRGNKKQEIVLAQIVDLVKALHVLNTEKPFITLTENQDQLTQRITYTEEKINKLVYELYGLSEEEIKIVEGK